MKKTIINLLKSTAISIGMAFAIFSLVGIIVDISYQGDFHLEHYRFTKMAVGCIIVGLGFGLPTFVYEKDSLPMPIKTIIHMGIGCSVYTITAYAVGWIGSAVTFPKGLFIAAMQLSVGFIIWFLFMRHYRKEAKIINERIQKMK